MISDIHGVSGNEMLRALAVGERNPHVLAGMARARMRPKIRQITEALDCAFFTEEHALTLTMMLDNIDHCSAQIATLDERIAKLCEPYARQIAQLGRIPGVGIRVAQDLIGETGVDMSFFPGAAHLCSWARLTPQVKESAGRRKGGSAAGKGNRYIRAALGEAVTSAGRTGTFLAAKLHRLYRRMPKKKAQVAVMRTQLTAAYALLSDPEAAYTDPGPDYYRQRAGVLRQARAHIRHLEHLGYKVTLEPLSPDDDAVAAVDPFTGELITPAARQQITPTAS